MQNASPPQFVLPAAFFQQTVLKGNNVTRTVKKLSHLAGLFEDEIAFANMNGIQIVYEVDAYLPVEHGVEGGLFFGLTHLYPGMVGNEYFMTHGHFHNKSNCAEYYWCTQGNGVLLLMDESRNTRAEVMMPGTLHYIAGDTAHRVVNTGNEILRFGACWPSDAGYNYSDIQKRGFSKRVKNIDNKPVFVLIG